MSEKMAVRLERFYCAAALLLMVVLFMVLVCSLAADWTWCGGIAAALVLGALAFQLKRNCLNERAVQTITGISLLGLCIAQIGIGLSLRYVPAWDLDAIYGGAIQWVETGAFSDYTEYFQYFSNNLGGMLMLAALFAPARMLGASDYFLLATVFNSALVTASVAITVWIAREWYGTAGGLWTLIFFLLCVPFYFMGPVFYTDTLSMIFPVALLALYIRLKETTAVRRWGYAVGMGVVLALGMTVKFTVLIMGIAIAVDVLLFHLCDRNTVLPMLILCGVTATEYVLIRCIFYPMYLDPAEAAQMNTPISHWIMMGLKGNGGYNGEDYVFTRSFTDPVARNEAISAEIGRRIRELGVTGLLDLAKRKWAVCFGDGTFVLDTFLDDAPLAQTWAHEWVMRDGAYFQWYRWWSQSIWIAALLLTGAAAGRGAKRRATAFSGAVPVLAVAGIMLFSLLWETSGRLVLHYVPIVFLAASGVMSGQIPNRISIPAE